MYWRSISLQWNIRIGTWNSYPPKYDNSLTNQIYTISQEFYCEISNVHQKLWWTFKELKFSRSILYDVSMHIGSYKTRKNDQQKQITVRSGYVEELSFVLL